MFMTWITISFILKSSDVFILASIQHHGQRSGAARCGTATWRWSAFVIITK